MEIPSLIEIRSDVMAGKPCLKGTRIPVYLVLEKLGAGETALWNRAQRTRSGTAGWASSSPFRAEPARPVR